MRNYISVSPPCSCGGQGFVLVGPRNSVVDFSGSQGNLLPTQERYQYSVFTVPVPQVTFKGTDYCEQSNRQPF